MNQRHRIFVAINLPEDVRKSLTEYQNRWSELPIRWTKPKNLHITLIFIGYVNNDELLEMCNLVKEVASKQNPFLINLNKICYGPPKKMPPRMIWAMGAKSQEFAALKGNLEKLLISSQEISFTPEKREFSPHITLGRIRQWEWRRIDPEESPEIDEDTNLSFEVNSIEIMESELKRGGVEYSILESVPLGRF